ncbi:hypothetical protein DF268_38840 [Streptomyces sp. V2]|uniref:Helix-turn-helix domain-containing protein n=1 Tax=Streptomyces niveiscabiei TaxID=164115 RepID=A0ABW9HYG9_9ACTN|nr:hypothetical protein [Streptomyces sp. V2]PWG08258.1 hypothetical protein DF268_38840 [Streptomyces sp. V2]
MESQIIRPGHLTAHQTARVLGVDLGTVRQLVRRGHLTRAGGTPRQPWYSADEAAVLAANRRLTAGQSSVTSVYACAQTPALQTT